MRQSSYTKNYSEQVNRKNEYTSVVNQVGKFYDEMSIIWYSISEKVQIGVDDDFDLFPTPQINIWSNGHQRKNADGCEVLWV